MSNVAQIDSNDKPTWLAYNETTGLVEPVYVDPVTNVLYVFGVAPGSETPTEIDRARIDANDKPTEIAYNETTGGVEALRCDINGVLLVVVEA